MIRCPSCDARLATAADRNEHGNHPLAGNTCWRFGGSCVRPPVNWRARALAAERTDEVLKRRLVIANGVMRGQRAARSTKRKAPRIEVPTVTAAVRATAIARTLAGAFAALRDLERTGPTEAASIRKTVVGEVPRWHALDAVPPVAEGAVRS